MPNEWTDTLIKNGMKKDELVCRRYATKLHCQLVNLVKGENTFGHWPSYKTYEPTICDNHTYRSLLFAVLVCFDCKHPVVGAAAVVCTGGHSTCLDCLTRTSKCSVCQKQHFQASKDGLPDIWNQKLATKGVTFTLVTPTKEKTVITFEFS